MFATIGCASGEPFIVWFEGNGGTLVSGLEAQSVNNAKDIVAPIYEYKYHEFLGWDVELSEITQNKIVTAQWRERYFLTFQGSNLVISTYPNKALGTLATPTEVVSGKTFRGWTVDSQRIDASSKWIWKDHKQARPIWTGENEHIIELFYKGGTVEEQNPLTYVSGGDDVAIINPTREGYTFMGWKDLSNPEGELQQTLVIDTDWTTDVKYEAQWEGNFYNVTFNARSGYLADNVKVMRFGDEIGELPVAKNGDSGKIKFLGWYYEGKKVEPTDTLSYAGDVEFLAKYEYVITYQLYTEFKERTIFVDVITGAPKNITVDSEYVVNSQFPDKDDIRLVNAPLAYYFYGWTVDGKKFDGTKNAYALGTTVEQLMEDLKNSIYLNKRKIKMKVEQTGEIVIVANVTSNWSDSY